jgi:hypothetical protein
VQESPLSAALCGTRDFNENSRSVLRLRAACGKSSTGRSFFEPTISENPFEKIEIRAIVFLCRWIEARLMLREGGRNKPLRG